jgi:hypothetical protein
LFNIDTAAVPVKERRNGEAVAKIMKARTRTVPDFSKPDLPTKLDKSPADHALCERSLLIGEEKPDSGMRGMKTLPQVEIPNEHLDG